MRHIDHLQAAADAEDRNAGLAGLLEESKVGRVPPFVELDARFLARRFSVAARVDVAPASQDKPRVWLRADG